KIIQWKPQKVESVKAKVFWEGVICACNEVFTQLMNFIRLGAEFQQVLAGVRSGIVDFVERCSCDEDVPFAIQGLNIQLDKYKDFQNKICLFIEKREKEVDKLVRQAFEKEKVQDNLSEVLQKAGLRSTDAVKEFFQAYDKFQQGLIVNYAGLVNIAKDINFLEQWFSLKFNTEIKLETLLRSSDLGALTQPLQTIGINKSIHLCRKGDNFDKDIRSRLQAIDDINPFDIDSLEDFCESLTIDHIKKQQKMKEQSIKMIVDIMTRPLYVFLHHFSRANHN
ncbi:hypothetical protein RFI_39690, partial [Reticulomyxa filosa]